ncbi:hypothetical protein Q2T40_14570 [Winogradskyella maritima]|uniref:DUF4142 domain-containing protein n=1 Tax=Winogradskyella maritima TaxID=1517766 RepID=A0ABV8AJG8_9FLAO|nr:hypothetical protein [Winogradskyella maritima]
MNFLQCKHLKKTALLLLAMTTLWGCDFIMDKKPDDSVNVDATQEIIISKDKEMAKLLVEATEKNYEIIEIVEQIKTISTPDSIEAIANDLEADHNLLSNAYNRIARESLISIPEESVTANQDYNIKNVDSLEPVLKIITNNIETQINALNQLEQAVDNAEIAQLTFKSKRVLKENLQKMENVINSI